jgi:hypothetical protein
MLTIRRLIWDAWNVAHIARHHVIPEEVEEVCHGQPVTSQTSKGRLMPWVDAPNRMLTVIPGPTDDAGSTIP